MRTDDTLFVFLTIRTFSCGIRTQYIAGETEKQKSRSHIWSGPAHECLKFPKPLPISRRCLATHDSVCSATAHPTHVGSSWPNLLRNISRLLPCDAADVAEVFLFCTARPARTRMRDRRPNQVDGELYGVLRTGADSAEIKQGTQVRTEAGLTNDLGIHCK